MNQRAGSRPTSQAWCAVFPGAEPTLASRAYELLNAHSTNDKTHHSFFCSQLTPSGSLTWALLFFAPKNSNVSSLPVEILLVS